MKRYSYACLIYREHPLQFGKAYELLHNVDSHGENENEIRGGVVKYVQDTFPSYVIALIDVKEIV